MSELPENVAIIPSEVVLNKEVKLPIYQRTSDGFFCLSQACRDVGKKPGSYLRSREATTIFATTGNQIQTISKVTLTNLVKAYPELIYAERSPSVIESGIWLSKIFMTSFYEWSGVTETNREQQLKQQELEFSYTEPITHYQFPHPDSAKNIDIYIRENDRFVSLRSAIDLGRKSAEKLLASHQFIKLLEKIKDTLGLDLDYESLNNSDIPYARRLGQIYAELYEVQIIEGKNTVWLHPAVALELSQQTSYYTIYLNLALKDSLNRNQNQYYITQISDFGCQTKTLPELELALFRYKGCQVSLIDTPKLLALDVRHPQSYWQYTIDLKTLEVSVRRDLLLYWGMAVNGIINKNSVPPHQQELLSAAEIERTDFSRPQERLIPETVNITFDPKITLDRGRRVGIIEFTKNGEDYYVETTVRFARSMAALRQLVQQTLLANDTNIRSKLLQMGYNSPLLPQYESQMETDNIGSMQIGKHKIYYRLSDGFINANSICRITEKRLVNWLATDRTWDLFAARAKELGMEINCRKNDNSINTRVSAAFTSLIERKRGSSLNGGGSWIENKSAIQLVI